MVTGKPNQCWPVSENSAQRSLFAPSRRLCAVTHVGRRRHNNEDKYFLSPDCRLWIVADGMGGHAAGEVASALTIEAIVASMDAPGDAPPHAEPRVSAGDRLRGAFAAAQSSVIGHSLRNSGCQGMGCTAIAGFVDDEALYLCHVGDVRGYHWSEGEFSLVTNDHSLVWELVKSGLMPHDAVRFHPTRSIVTQAIGGMKGIVPDLARLPLKSRDRVLLCSDGLWEELADREIRRVICAEGSMLELATLLVDQANAAGGKDNITAVLYEHAAAKAAHSCISLSI
jgi:protein phosphatase